MICDTHVHIAGIGTQGSGNRLAPSFLTGTAFQRFMRALKLPADVLQSPDCDSQIARRIVAWIDESVLDCAVLLAFDAAHHADGSVDTRTLLVTDNDFVADLASNHRKILFGASVHPYRRDAVAELERLIARGACLVKWLPGAQNIQPDHPRCLPFYEVLAQHRIPLLCHTGVEHTVKIFPNTLNDPVRLIPALERGVVVIAAHCGSRVFLHEKSYFRCWREMAERYEGFYGDISAFGMITRIWVLRQLLESPALTAKLVFGSDFPATPMPLSCLGPVRLRHALEVRRMTNPFDKVVHLMRAAGVPPSVFARAQQLLRIPQRRTVISKTKETPA
jgi:predicted TIM-barrel fold metal-dependent hydrolase